MADLAAVMCTGGGSTAFKYRADLPEVEAGPEGRPYTPQGDGVYLTFRHEGHEDYLRGGKPMNGAALDKRGVSYVASNNVHRNAQIYSFPRSPLGPETPLTPVFASMPDGFKKTAGFSTAREPVTLAGGGGLEGEAAEWFLAYRATLLAELKALEVPLPDHSSVADYYAQRSEWYWTSTTQDAECASDGGRPVPVFFLGDAAGCTDYWRGQSGGRGLLAGSALAGMLAQLGVADAKAAFQEHACFGALAPCETSERRGAAAIGVLGRRRCLRVQPGIGDYVSPFQSVQVPCRGSRVRTAVAQRCCERPLTSRVLQQV